MKRKLQWLIRNLRHPQRMLCFNCWMAHIDQYRDVQLGDVWRCKEGNHWNPRRVVRDSSDKPVTIRLIRSEGELVSVGEKRNLYNVEPVELQYMDTENLLAVLENSSRNGANSATTEQILSVIANLTRRVIALQNNRKV